MGVGPTLPIHQPEVLADLCSDISGRGARDCDCDLCIDLGQYADRGGDLDSRMGGRESGVAVGTSIYWKAFGWVGIGGWSSM
jgi:hypothetical protein